MPKKKNLLAKPFYVRLYNSFRRNFLILLAISGIIFSTLFSFATGKDKQIKANYQSEPAISPYKIRIAGVGFIEASSENIRIGTFKTGIVGRVEVKEGQFVEQGDILFALDSSKEQAKYALRSQQLETAKKNIEVSKVNLKDLQDRWQRAEGLKSGRSISEDELNRRFYAKERAIIELDLAGEKLNEAMANLDVAKVDLDQTIIKAPISGRILQVNIRPGELVSNFAASEIGLLLIGADRPFNVRVQIDESDIWRFDTSAAATAFLRSNNKIKLPLIFDRLEPYAKQKVSLIGSGPEIVDTRILEIIYRIDQDKLASPIDDIYIGQQLDIFIESKKGQ